MGEAARPRPESALLRSGIFDLDYYTAASGEVFADRRAAAGHCAGIGMPSGLSPSPFLTLAYLPRPAQQAWLRGHPGRLMRLLNEVRSPYGPLFDPQVYLDSLTGTELDAAVALGPLPHFLVDATDDTDLPTPSGRPARLPVPTLGEARAELIRLASSVAAQTHDVPGRQLSFHEGITPWRRGQLPLAMQGPGGPLVSVTAPLPRSAAGVSAAVLALQGQTLHRWELVLVGEAPPGLRLYDGRARVVAPLEGEDWRDTGLRVARGQYVAFLTPGHHWRADFLRSAVQRLHDTGRAGGQGAVSLRDRAGREALVAGPVDHTAEEAARWFDSGAFVCLTDTARAVGGLSAGPDSVRLVAQRSPIDAFPFVASDRLVASLPTIPSSAAGADADWLAVIGQAWVDWADVRERLPERVPGRVSVVVPTYQDAAMTTTAVRTLLATSSVPDLEMIVVDNGSPMALSQEMGAAFLGEERVRYHRLPVNLNFAIACNVGVAHSTGSTVVFLNNDTRSETDWLPEVVEHLDDPTVAGVQPVLLYPDGTIQTAGTVFPGENGLACHFLTGRPLLDALPAASLTFHAATAAALAMRAADVAALHGFDAHYVNGMEDVDLCLRALRLRPGGFRVEPRSFVTHLEGKTPGRGRRIPENRRFFMSRWSGRLPGPEVDMFTRAGFELVRVEDDGLEIPSPRPVIRPLPR